ncbi:hypothetical protein MXD94_04640, partial [Staphylococcus aureus]|uniref:hypothetical protein n=1 Tax=Staphylococcus aureus TaxID=1280 RepID=UPI0022236243
PQHREFQKEILQTMQVGGAPTQKLTAGQLTLMCKLGNDAPKKDDSKFIVVTTSSIITSLLLL